MGGREEGEKRKRKERNKKKETRKKERKGIMGTQQTAL